MEINGIIETLGGRSAGEKKPSRKFDWADTNIGVNKKKAAT